MIDWTHEDQVAALADGWGVFDNSDHGERIERLDEAQRFDCDSAAIAYVAMRAVYGDTLARKAFEYLAHVHAVLDAADPTH